MNKKSTFNVTYFLRKDKQFGKQAKDDKDKQTYKHDLLGVYGGDVTDNEIAEYVSTHETKKVLVTYDSLERVITTLQKNGIDVYKDYYLLIDEWHILFNSYMFRNEAIKKVLHHCTKFNEFTAMTATPLENELILEELKHLPIVRVEWKNAKTVNVIPIQTNIPANVVRDLINNKLEDKIFGNLHFFVNSVKFIGEILKKSKVPPEYVRVVCADKTENQTKLGDVLSGRKCKVVY